MGEVSSAEVFGKDSRRQPEESGSSRGVAIYAIACSRMRLPSPAIRL
jgi:hypothetical protein